MRKAIDSAPRNGDFVILEDGVRGTIAVARWSAEAAQWLDERGTPSQLNATHWHPPQNRDEEGTPSQLNATYWQSLTPAQSAVKMADKLGLLTAPSKASVWHNHSEASRPASGGITTRPQRAAVPARSVNVWARFVDFAGHGRGKFLSAFAVAGGWIVRRRRSIVAMAACLLVGAAFGPFLHSSDPGKWLLHQTASENDTGLKQALRQEQDRASKLAREVTAVRREAELQATFIRQARETADREEKASERALVELRQALQLELSKTEKLTAQLAETQHDIAAQTALTRKTIDDATRMKEVSDGAAGDLRRALQQAQDKAEKLASELAITRQELEAQTAVAQTANDEARRAADRSKRSAEEQSQALREAQGKAETLATELAAARREAWSQVSAANSAKDEAAGLKEAAERSADEQRRALQHERDRTETLSTQLAETRSSLETQAKAKAAEEAARDDQLAALRQELQRAKAEATVARESFEVERTRTQRMEQQLTSIQESTGGRPSRSPAAAAPTVGQPSTAAPSAPEAQTKAPTMDAAQPANSATRADASVRRGSPHAIRLIARANLLLDQGNIGAARNMLDRAAEMGSAEALFWLAETYDPLLLSARKTFGTQSDIAMARELYGKALAGGVSEAKFRLEALHQGIGGEQ